MAIDLAAAHKVVQCKHANADTVRIRKLSGRNRFTIALSATWARCTAGAATVLHEFI
ncbi:hypothetical protein [Paraburkholderia ginsengiterrae]|uniref:hypothetical protein n=1 Tax=Paraburkholderia ginsengiterrae TaxID=1462993 RepID=UPI000AFA0449|nr:hypothetical protein [Paraburkholderia ginsengiterrae]